MYEYKVEKCMLKEAEQLMNSYAQDGWRVISTSYIYSAITYDYVIVFERAAF